MTAPRRVLHVLNTAAIGGGAEHLRHLADGLRAHGYASTIVVGNDGPARARWDALGVPVRVLGHLGVTAPLALRRAIATAAPDLVHLHGSRAGYWGALAVRSLPQAPPVVYTAHAFAFHRALPAPLLAAAAAMERVTTGTAARTICLSHGDAAAAAARGVDAARTCVIYNGIEVEHFATATPDRAALGVPANATVIAMIARLVPQKDPLAFVAAAAELAPRERSLAFVLVGDGPLRAEVHRAVDAAGLHDRLRLTGAVDDVARVLASVDVVVAPSLWEGLPLGILEAMAAGRAVLASDLPGHAEIVEHGVSGLLHRAPASWAAAIAQLAHDPGLRAALGAAAHQRVRAAFTRSRMVADTAAVYDAVLRSA